MCSDETDQISESEDSTCKTVLLDDSPVSKDAFGSHDQLAKTIVEMIRTDKGGKAITLIGDWGSGKSSIVNFMESYLTKDEIIFRIDAWVHNGDSLNRAILENLGKYLSSPKIKWLKWCKCKKVKQKINNVIKPRTTTLTKISLIATLVGLFTLLIPFVLSILSAYGPKTQIDFTREFLNSNNLYSFRTNLPIFLLQWLIIVLVILALIQIIFRMTFFTPQTVTETIPGFSPTSVDFQSTLSYIINQALPRKKEKRRLILVIDNIDRITDPFVIKLMWSTIISFFDLSDFINDKKDNPFRRFWILVPLNPKFAEFVWNLDIYNDQPGLENKKQNIADEFINKTFAARFYVPPLILKDWRDYLKKHLRCAFPKHLFVETELDDICDLFMLKYDINDDVSANTESNPTPREIKLFVNKIGSLHRLWCGKFNIDLKIMAYYIIIENKLLDNPNVIADKLPNPKHVITDDYRAKLAAMYYGKQPDDAIQLLTEKVLRDELWTLNSSRLEVLASNKHFNLVFYKFLASKYCRSGGIQNFLALASYITKLNVNDNNDLRNIWHLLNELLFSETTLSIMEINSKDGLIAIWEHNKDKLDTERIKKLVIKIKGFPGAPENEKQVKFKNWVVNLYEVIKYLHHEGFRDVLVTSFNLNHFFGDSAKELLIIYRNLSELDYNDQIIQYFAPNQDQVAFIHHLFMDQTKERKDELGSLPLMLKIIVDWKWNNLIEFYKRNISVDKIDKPGIAWEGINIAIQIIAILYLEGNIESAKEYFSDINNISLVSYLLTNPEGKIAEKEIALWFLILYSFNPSGKIEKTNLNEKAAELIEGTYYNISRYGLNEYNNALMTPENSKYINDMLKYYSKYVTKNLIEFNCNNYPNTVNCGNYLMMKLFEGNNH
jgi:hypothetical protein